MQEKPETKEFTLCYSTYRQVFYGVKVRRVVPSMGAKGGFGALATLYFFMVMQVTQVCLAGEPFFQAHSLYINLKKKKLKYPTHSSRVFFK